MLQVLFMVLPTLVVHPIDGWSPLVPPRAASQPYVSMSAYEFPDVLCRASRLCGPRWCRY